MKARWVGLPLIFFGIVINYIDRGSLSIAAPSIMHDFRITPATMGVILSAFFWTYGICQFPAGAIVDRFGIRGSYAVGFIIWSQASASIALCTGPGQIAGARMVPEARAAVALIERCAVDGVWVGIDCDSMLVVCRKRV